MFLDASAPPSGSPFDWPAFGLQDDVRRGLAQAMAAGQAAVIATLYDVVGGAPRGVGAQMLFTDGEIRGFLSGGCIEADVALHAAEVLRQGAPRRLVYGDGGPADIALPCGSRIDVLLERIGPGDEAARALLAAADERRPAVWITDGEARSCLAPEAVESALRPTPDDPCRRRTAPFAVSRLYAPPRRLIVVGGDPIALALTRLGGEMGFEVTLVRPKGPEAPPPGQVRYIRSDAAAALTTLEPDAWTALAVLLHDPALEHVALRAALATDAGYIGALGSRRRIPERNARLLADGVDAEAIRRLHAPIGLAIGGKSPWEIAVAILSEIVAEGARAAA